MKLLRSLFGLLSLGGLMAMTTSSAAAASISSITFVDAGNQLFAFGTLEGLDPTQGAQVNMTIAGSATVTCVGPTPDVKTGVSVSQGSRATRLLPGDANFAVFTSVPTVTPENAQCPVGTLAVSVGDVDFQRAVITVIQGSTIVLQAGYRQNPGGVWHPV